MIIVKFYLLYTVYLDMIQNLFYYQNCLKRGYMRVVSLQLPVYLGDVEKNVNNFTDEIAQIVDDQPTIFLLPEMWACGFDYEKLLEYSKETEQILNRLSEIIGDNDLVIATNPEENYNKVYNTVYAVGKNGVKAKYRKNFLFTPMKEDVYIDKGNNLCVFDHCEIDLALHCCYEIRFPELFRQSAFNGAKVILVPAIWPGMKKDHWMTLLRARAIENQCYVIGCNCSIMHTRKKPMLCGFSAAYDPWGTPLFDSLEEEGVYAAEIDVNLVDEVREKIPSFSDANETYIINRRT